MKKWPFAAQFVSLLQMQLFIYKSIGTYGEQVVAPLEGAGVHTILTCSPVPPAQELLVLHGDRRVTQASVRAGDYRKVNHWG